MKKKVFGLMLVGCICGLMVTGCGGGSEPDKKDTKPTETVEATETEEPEKVAKEETKNIRWPKSELSDLLPVPKAEIGNVILNDSSSFSVEINDVSEDDFNEYIDECIEKGFTVDYTRIDDCFNGENENGYFLSLMYMDDDQMLISLNAPQPTEETEEPAEAPAEPTEQPTEAPVETEASAEPAVLPDTIRPEIKEAIDSYEAFFDEYCAFMQKYQESNGDLSLMGDYADYLARYADMLQKFEAMENEDLTDAELAYYVEVSGRIMEKTAQFY